MKTILRRMESVFPKNNGKLPEPDHCWEYNLYSSEEFRKRLLIEKRRAERLNSISSIVAIRPKKRPHNNSNDGNFSKQYAEHLVKTISASLRETDAIPI